MTALLTDSNSEEERTALHVDCCTVLRITSFNSSKVILQEFCERITNIKLKHIFELH